MNYGFGSSDPRYWQVTKVGNIANEAGNLVSGQVISEYHYDVNFRLIKIIRPNQAGDSSKPYIENEYALDGKLKETREWITDDFFNVRTNDYDFLNGATTKSTISLGTDSQSTSSQLFHSSTQTGYGGVRQQATAFADKPDQPFQITDYSFYVDGMAAYSSTCSQ